MALSPKYGHALGSVLSAPPLPLALPPEQKYQDCDWLCLSTPLSQLTSKININTAKYCHIWPLVNLSIYIWKCLYIYIYNLIHFWSEHTQMRTIYPQMFSLILWNFDKFKITLTYVTEICLTQFEPEIQDLAHTPWRQSIQLLVL